MKRKMAIQKGVKWLPDEDRKYLWAAEQSERKSDDKSGERRGRGRVAMEGQDGARGKKLLAEARSIN